MNYQELLFKYDEIDSYETPKNFDYQKLKIRIQRFKTELELKLNVELKIDDQIQDASFFCDIILPENLIQDSRNNYLYAIRFSNFGELVSFTFTKHLINSLDEKIVKMLTDSKFNYIPHDILDEDYDGRFNEFKNILGPYNIPSWWIRYFDYL